MSGLTNVGAHRTPLMKKQCDQIGHMEGCLNAVVVDDDHKGRRLLATYVIEFDAGSGSPSTLVKGSLEGILICDGT
jgi:hypothetical protein